MLSSSRQGNYCWLFAGHHFGGTCCRMPRSLDVLLSLQVQVGWRRLLGYVRSDWPVLILGAGASAVLGIQVRFSCKSTAKLNIRTGHLPPSNSRMLDPLVNMSYTAAEPCRCQQVVVYTTLHVKLHKRSFPAWPWRFPTSSTCSTATAMHTSAMWCACLLHNGSAVVLTPGSSPRTSCRVCAASQRRWFRPIV